MQHADQHREAISPTIRIKNQVIAGLFDDKVKRAGDVSVEGGKITITLDHAFGMVSQEATRDFLIEAISISLAACFDAHPEAFDPYAKKVV